MIEKKNTKFLWTPCVVHSLNLALKRICESPQNSSQHSECKWIADLASDVHNIRNLIVNHSCRNKICITYIVITKHLKELKPAMDSKAREEKQCIVNDTRWDDLDYREF